MIDWTGAQMARYRARQKLPRSDVAALLHRSGGCNCAARGRWWEERERIKPMWPQWFAQTIEALESEAAALGIRWCRWGGFDLQGNRSGELGAEQPGPLCVSCVGEQMSLSA